MSKRISPLEFFSRNIANMSNFVEFLDCRNFTFFEALSVECRKTTCDVKKVTYKMYSCDTCYMSRDTMEMDGRDSVKSEFHVFQGTECRVP